MTDHILDNLKQSNINSPKTTLATSGSKPVHYPQIIQRAVYDFSLLSLAEIFQLQALMGNQKVAGLMQNSEISTSESSVGVSSSEIHEHNAGTWTDPLSVQGNMPIQMVNGKKNKKKDAMSRLQRLHKRQTAKYNKNPVTLGKRQDAPTPFGMTGLSRQRFGDDPQTTTRSEDFEDCASVGSRYMEFLPKIGKKDKWKVMNKIIAKAGKPPKTIEPEAKRAMAMLYGTIRYSEDYRFPGAAKIARSAMRKVEKDKQDSTPPKELSNYFIDLFPMAGIGGKNFYQNILAGKQKLTKKQEKVIEEMSDSSDDE